MKLPFLRSKARPKAPVNIVAEQTAGGIYKRIDENRELLQLLRAEAPQFLEKNSWVVGWIRSNDEFLTALEPHVLVERPLFAKRAEGCPGGMFPRPWPEDHSATRNSNK